MMQADVEELRTRLEEKNRLIEKKTQAALQAVQERNRVNNELTELKDHMDIKDRKINVLQRKVCDMNYGHLSYSFRTTKRLAHNLLCLRGLFTRYFGVYFRFVRRTGFPTFCFLICDEKMYILWKMNS